MGLTIIESQATNLIPWLLLSLSSLLIFTLNGIVDYRLGAVLSVGMAVGGYFGAHALLKIGDFWVKRLFSLIILLSAIKLLFS